MKELFLLFAFASCFDTIKINQSLHEWDARDDKEMEGAKAWCYGNLPCLHKFIKIKISPDGVRYYRVVCEKKIDL